MAIAETKKKIHELVDMIENNEMLELYYSIISFSINKEKYEVLSSLSETSLNELYLSYNESFSEENLIENEAVKQKYKKWLEG